MGNMNQHIVYEDGNWTIELRPRNNTHAGEPDMKVWVCKRGQEVAQYSNHYRGYGHYEDHEELLPENVSAAAKNAWELLKEAPFNADAIDDFKTKIKESLESAPAEETAEESSEE